MQINKRSLNTNDIRNVRELEEKQQEIKRFMLDVLEDAYWKELQICQKTNDTHRRLGFLLKLVAEDNDGLFIV